MSPRLRTLALCAVALPVALLTACGDTTTIPQVTGATPFATSHVTVHQAGNAPVSVDDTTVNFALDAARSVVAVLDVRSTAQRPVTVAVRGTIYDPKGNIVGDLTGGQVDVVPGSVAHVRLTGPTPLGTIASAVFEVSSLPLPT